MLIPVNRKDFNMTNNTYIFRQVAAMCGLRISYYIAAALLSLTVIILPLIGYRTATPIYILFTMALLPGLTHAMFFSSEKNEKRENGTPFPLFRKKYKYNPNRHKALNISHLLLFILLAAWRFSYAGTSGLSVYVTELPTGIAIISILSRILITAFYHLYFRFFPLKAMR